MTTVTFFRKAIDRQEVFFQFLIAVMELHMSYSSQQLAGSPMVWNSEVTFGTTIVTLPRCFSRATETNYLQRARGNQNSGRFSDMIFGPKTDFRGQCFEGVVRRRRTQEKKCLLLRAVMFSVNVLNPWGQDFI